MIPFRWDLVKDAKPRNLTSGFDWDVGASVFGDNAAPRGGGGNRPLWSPDGKSIVENFAKEGQTNHGSFDEEFGESLFDVLNIETWRVRRDF